MRLLRRVVMLGVAYAAQRLIRRHVPSILRAARGLPAAVASRPARHPHRRMRDALILPTSPIGVLPDRAPQPHPDWLDDRDVEAGGARDPLAPGATGGAR